MPEVEISKIIKSLKSRNDAGASSQFIDVFSRVVRVYLDYRKWVRMMIGKNGHYQYKGPDQILSGFIGYITLIEDIEKNGIKTPVKEFWDHCGYELDGYHRLIIWRELGHEKIEIDGKTIHDPDCPPGR